MAPLSIQSCQCSTLPGVHSCDCCWKFQNESTIYEWMDGWMERWMNGWMDGKQSSSQCPQWDSCLLLTTTHLLAVCTTTTDVSSSSVSPFRQLSDLCIRIYFEYEPVVTHDLIPLCLCLSSRWDRNHTQNWRQQFIQVERAFFPLKRGHMGEAEKREDIIFSALFLRRRDVSKKWMWIKRR